MTVPLWTVAVPLRETVDPATLGSEVVHYSIPAFEATGQPAVEPSDTIKSLKLRVRGGELLVSKLNPRKSRVLLVPPVSTPTVASTEFVAFRPVAAEPRFLVYCLSAESTRQLLDSNVRSVTRSHQRVEPEVIARVPIPAIPLDEQRRIADFLDTETTRLDAVAQSRTDQARLLAERVQAILDLRLSELERGHGLSPLRRELRSIEQGASPQCESNPAEPDQFGVLKLSAVNGGRYLEDENKALPAGVDGDLRFEVRAGDLLMSRANTPQRVGDVAFVRETRPRLLLPDLLYRLTLDRPSEAEFVAAALRSTRVRALLSVTARGTSQSMVKLRGEDIASIAIPAAPSTERGRAVEAIHAAEEISQQLKERIADGEALLCERRRALITAAVTGQLDVTTARGIDTR